MKLQKLYSQSNEEDKQEVNKMLNNDFQIVLEDNDINKYIENSNTIIKSPFNQDKVQFADFLLKYDIKLSQNELQQIENKLKIN